MQSPRLTILLMAGAVLLVAASLIGPASSDDSETRARVEETVAELRAAGIPVDEPSLKRYYEQITSRQHTAQWLDIIEQIESSAFTQAAQSMPYLGDGGTDVPRPDEPWAAQQDVESFLTSQQPLLDQIHDAARESSAVWLPIEVDDWFIHRQALRDTARLLSLEHDAAVYAGQSKRAGRSLRSLLGLAETMWADPFTGHQLTRIAIHGVAMRALRLSLEQDLVDIKDERMIAALLERLSLFEDYKSPYQFAHIGDRVLVLADYRDPMRLGKDSRFAESDSPARDVLLYLKFYERCEQVSEKDDLDAFVRSAELVRKETAARADMLGLSDTPGHADHAFARALARQVMHSRLAKLAIGVRLYEHRFKAWPEKLEHLVAVGIHPASLMPLGGKPFGYSVDGNLAMLWGFEPTFPDVAREVPEAPPLGGWEGQVQSHWVWRLSRRGP